MIFSTTYSFPAKIPLKQYFFQPKHYNWKHRPFSIQTYQNFTCVRCPCIFLRNRPSLLMKRKNDNSLLRYLSFYPTFFSKFCKNCQNMYVPKINRYSATMIDSLDGGDNSTVIAKLVGSHPHLKSPHQPCGTPHNICGILHQLCGIQQKHAEYQHFLCGIPHEHAELRRGFTICGISSASLIGNFSAPAAEKSDLILF